MRGRPPNIGLIPNRNASAPTMFKSYDDPLAKNCTFHLSSKAQRRVFPIFKRHTASRAILASTKDLLKKRWLES